MVNFDYFLIFASAPLSGHLRLDILDEAYATVLVGLVGTKMDIARARFCFNGHIEYNLNILQVSLRFETCFLKAVDTNGNYSK